MHLIEKRISGAAAIWVDEISLGVVREFIVLFEIRVSGIDNWGSEKICNNPVCIR